MKPAVFLKLMPLVFVTIFVLSAKSETIRLKASDDFNTLTSKVQTALARLPKHDLILIGEDHRDVYGKRLVTKAMVGLHVQDHQRCYFVEEGPEYQAAFDFLPKSERMASSLHRQIFDKFTPVFAKFNGRNPSYWTDFDNLGSLSRAGFKIIAIDRTENEATLKTDLELKKKAEGQNRRKDDEARYEYYSTGARNEVMAHNINTLFTKKQCRSGAFVVGKYHLFFRYNHPAFPIRAVQDLVSVPVSTVNVAECSRPGACDSNLDWADLNLLIDP